MGNEWSLKKNETNIYPPEGTKLLSLHNLSSVQYDIENLAFSSGGAKALAYAGAVKVLELTGVLKHIKRFAGAGTGALIAALLALGFESDNIQKYYNKHLEALILDDKEGFAYVSTSFYQNFGWNSGNNFLGWFADLLEAKSYAPELSFWQLYQVTKIELCIIVTNIGKMSTMYCHPKTTPDMPIRRAILMSLSLPGIYIPKEYKTEHELCIHGGLVCSYPIHVFDGWWLSMDPKDSFLNKCDSAIAKSPSRKFESKNPKTLGFMFIDKHQENHKELIDRLSSANAIGDTPPTILGNKYEEAMWHQLSTETEYFILRKACKKLFTLAEEVADDGGIIVEEELANRMFKEDLLGLEYRSKLLPSSIEDEETCAAYLKSIRDDEPRLYLDLIKLHFEKKARSLLETNSDYYNNNRGLHGLFGSIANVYQNNSLKLSRDNYERTVGILCKYIGINDVNMELADQYFLYQQGWNASVVFLRQFSNGSQGAESLCSP